MSRQILVAACIAVIVLSLMSWQIVPVCAGFTPTPAPLPTSISSLTPAPQPPDVPPLAPIATLVMVTPALLPPAGAPTSGDLRMTIVLLTSITLVAVGIVLSRLRKRGGIS